MKGPLHERLRQTIRAAIKAPRESGEGVTQTSLSAAIGAKTQTGIGKYLNGHPKAGALDLDEADAALKHIGSSLDDFLRETPPRDLTFAERMARALLTRPDLADFIEDLLLVPKTQLGDVLETARGLARLASGKPLRRGDGPTGGTKAGPRTTVARVKRR